jgi:hypothetical protein
VLVWACWKAAAACQLRMMRLAANPLLLLLLLLL